MGTSCTLLAGTVLTMRGDEVLVDQALHITDGRITAVSPRTGAELRDDVVDWRDRTVLPALADMHAHVSERADMLTNLAHGVTLLRNMWGNPWHLFWQAQVAAGRETGPHLVTTSPIVDGRGVTGRTVLPGMACVETAEQAHAAVARWAELGYQQVKAYNWSSHKAMRGLGEACADAGLVLAGHCPQAMTVPQAMGYGQTSFEHLSGYEYGALVPAARERLDSLRAETVGRRPAEMAELRLQIDPVALRDLAAEVADRGVPSVATLIYGERMYGPKDFSDPRLAGVPPSVVESWRPENNDVLRRLSPTERERMGAAWNQRTGRLLAALRDAGARVLVGTDAPNPFVQGSSVVEEMELLVAAGYGAAEVVRMATRDAAGFLGLDDRGTVAVGSVADLLGVEGDPTSSVGALRDPAGVVVGGRVLERPDLERLLDEAQELLAAGEEALPDLPEDEDLVGDYVRTGYGRPAGRARVSCCSPGGGLARSTEHIVDRGRSESRRTVVDTAGVLVEAQVRRRYAGSQDSATVRRREEDGSYDVTLVHLDGAVTAGTVPGPLVPGHDLGTPALLDALARAGGAAVRALTLVDAFDHGLLPVPVPVVPEDGGHVLRGASAHVRVRGADDLAGYEVRHDTEDLAFTRER